MTRLIEVKLDEESSIYIEVEEDNAAHGPETAASFNSDVIETKGKEYLDKAFDTIKKTIVPVINEIKNLGTNKPDEIELSLNVKLSTESKVILSSLGAEGNFGVKLKWKKDSD